MTRYVASIMDGFGAQVDPDGKVSLAINDPQFTSTDPVAGGNENAYMYPADPVNSNDVTGKYSYKFKLFSAKGMYGTSSKLMTSIELRLPWLFPMGGAPILRPGKNKGKRFWLSDNFSKIAAPLAVRYVNSTAFSFKALFGHPEWPGKITFSIRNRKGNLYLNVTGVSKNPYFGDYGQFGPIWRAAESYPLWKQFAKNIKNAYRGGSPRFA